MQKRNQGIIDDFSFSMIIQFGNDLKTLTVFKKMLTFDGLSSNEEQIGKGLITNYEGKTVEGEYLNKVGDYDGSEVMANTLTFVD